MKRLLRATVVVSVLALATSVVPTAAVGADALTVNTDAGAVRGVNNGATNEWRGVPYAAPPLGARRWRPPAPASPWSGVRSADTFEPQCIQLGLSQPVEGSEDCLYLNVFAPATLSSAALPVMVQLHGGGNFFFHPYTNAKAFVEHGVIVVTVGYRLGVFGFAGHPVLSTEGGGSSGEYGLFDQIAALHWVQNNIGAFGGDPDNVTLFGESAGSFDAVAIAASPLGTGLFSRLAAQTETFFAARGTDHITDAEDIGLEVAQRVGCSGEPDVAACLRAKPADQLVLAAGPDNVQPWVGGVVLPASPLELIAAQAAPRPMLLGSNREEASLDFAPYLVSGDPYPLSAWVRETNDLVGPQHGAEARSLYPLESFDSALWSTIGLFTDAIYTCPIRQLALATGGPVYRYLFTHQYQNDPVAAAFRAAHFFDDPLLWHDSTLLEGFLGRPNYEFSAQEAALSARMAAYWTNFAKTGDPNGAGLPPWPLYTSGSERIPVLNGPAAEIAAYRVEECAFLDRLPALFAGASEYPPSRSPVPR